MQAIIDVTNDQVAGADLEKTKPLMERGYGVSETVRSLGILQRIGGC